MRRQSLTMIGIVTACFAGSVWGQNTRNVEYIKDFLYYEKKDVMTDKSNIYIRSASKKNHNVGIFWTCVKSELRPGLHISDPVKQMKLLGTFFKKPYIQYRFGDSKAVGPTKEWEYLGKGVFYVPKQKVPQFTQKSRKAIVLKARVWGQDGERVGTWQFSMMGLQEALGRLPCYE